MAVERKMVRRQPLNSSQLSRAPEILTLAASIISVAFFSMATKISGSANSPISIGRIGMPASISVMPKEKRDRAPMGSWPIMPRNKPTASINKPLTNTPDDVPAITISAIIRIAANSGGPNNNATAAIGPISAMVIRSLVRSPVTDENKAISRAFRASPFLVRAGPSKVVATAAPVPGMDTSMAGIEPP